MREHRSDLPSGADEVVARCLAKPREERFANVAELAFALAPLGGKLGVESAARVARILGVAQRAEAGVGQRAEAGVAQRAEAGAAPSAEPEEQTTAPLARGPSEPRGRALFGFSAGAGLVLLALVWWLWPDASIDQASESATPTESAGPMPTEASAAEESAAEESAAPAAKPAPEGNAGPSGAPIASASASSDASARPRASALPAPRDPYGSRK
jgi:serine/threonine-protein kinase